MFGFGRAMAVDDQSEIVFRSLEASGHGKEILLVLVHTFRWTQAASGAAG